MKIKKSVVLIVVAMIVANICTVAFCACDNDEDSVDNNLTFVMPDGTPALAGATFLDTTISIANGRGGSNNVSGQIVASTMIQTAMGGESADVLIAPTNLGASLIKRGAPYKLVAVAVEGSLYIIGKPEKVGGSNTITLDDLKGKRIASIGQNNTPDKVFRYIIDNTDTISYSDFTVEFVTDGPAAKIALMRENDPCDFALVGEPAATAFGTPNGGGYSARLDIQALWENCGFQYNYPQASLFVKEKYANDQTFIDGLLQKLQDNITWVKSNSSEVAQYMHDKGSATTFPAPSIARCGVVVQKPDNLEIKGVIEQYLTLMTGQSGWDMIF